MKKNAIVFLCVCLLALSAFAVSGFRLDTANRIEFTDCSASGSSGQTFSFKNGPATFLVRVTDEDSSLCLASTCASGGEKFPKGTMIAVTFGSGDVVSCRSTGSTGDIIITRIY